MYRSSLRLSTSPARRSRSRWCDRVGPGISTSAWISPTDISLPARTRKKKTWRRVRCARALNASTCSSLASSWARGSRAMVFIFCISRYIELSKRSQAPFVVAVPTTPGGASVHAAGAAGPVGLAELELLELAGGGADQGVPDLDRGRALVVRHAAPTVLHQVPLGATGARAQDHERLDRLAPLLVGHADHRDLGHRLMLEEAVLDLDGRDVLAAGDDHVLLPIADRDEGVVGVAAVTGMEPAVDDGLGGLLGLVPVALEDVVGAREHLALRVHAHPHAHRGYAGAAEPLRALDRIEPVPLRGGPVDGEQGRGLGETVDLDELPAQLGLDPLDGPGRRRRPRDDHPHPALPGHRHALRPTGGGRVEHRRDHRRRAVEEGHPRALHAAQDLLSVALPDDDVPDSHRGHRAGHPPAV